MNWNDWESVWRRQQPPLGAEADVETLQRSFEQKRRQQARMLFVRDILEASAGVLVAAVFSYQAWKMGNAGWPIAGAVVLVLGVPGFFLRERLRARRAAPDIDASLLARIDADLAELRHQRRLLRNVWAWYLAPLAAAIAIVLVTLVRATPAWNPLHDPVVIGGFAAFFAACFLFAWEINRRAVRSRVEPRIRELEKLRAQFPGIESTSETTRGTDRTP